MSEKQRAHEPEKKKRTKEKESKPGTKFGSDTKQKREKDFFYSYLILYGYLCLNREDLETNMDEEFSDTIFFFK